MKYCPECGTEVDPDVCIIEWENADDCGQCWARWHNYNYGIDCCNLGPAAALEDSRSERVHDGAKAYLAENYFRSDK